MGVALKLRIYVENQYTTQSSFKKCLAVLHFYYLDMGN